MAAANIWGKWWLKLGVSFLIIAWLLWALDWEKLGQSLGRVSIYSLLGCLGLALVLYLILAIRWHLLIRETVQLSWRQNLAYYFRANLMNTFTPALVGGDVYRVVALKSQAQGVAPLIQIIIKERIIGLTGYLVFFLLCAAWVTIFQSLQPELHYFLLMAILVLALALLGVLFASPMLHFILGWKAISQREKLHGWLKGLQQSVNIHQTPSILSIMALSLLGVWIWVAAVQVVAAQMEVQISWALMGAVTVLVELARLVPVTLQGIGIREGTFTYILRLAGISPETAFVIGAASYFAVTLAMLITGSLGFMMKTGELGQADKKT